MVYRWEYEITKQDWEKFNFSLLNKSPIYFVGILILLLYSCSTVEIKPPTDNEVSYLKSIRKFILYFPEKIEVEMVKAGMQDSLPSPSFLKEMNKDAMENAYSKSIAAAFNQSMEIQICPTFPRIEFLLWKKQNPKKTALEF